MKRVACAVPGDTVIAQGALAGPMAGDLSGLWRAHVDGGCNPNPEGVMGLGVHLVDPAGNVSAQLAEQPGGRGTSNTAEFHAVLRALQEAKRKGARRLEVVADSRLTVGMLTGRMRAHKAHLADLLKRVRREQEDFDEVLYRWVPREQNKDADRLASLAIERVTGRKRGSGRSGSAPAGEKGKAVAVDTRCSVCDKECTFTWQVFKDGRKHIRQECPVHGFLRYAPKEEPFVELADSRS